MAVEFESQIAGFFNIYLQNDLINFIFLDSSLASWLEPT